MQPFWSRARCKAQPGFNRYLVLLAAAAAHLCIGQVYALSVFYGPVAAIFSADASADAASASHLGTVFTLGMVCLGLSAAVGGRWSAALGPRAMLLLSASLFSGGLVLGGLAIESRDVLGLYLGYGVIGGVGLGLGYLAPLQTLVEWFPERKGLATGVAITGFGGGAMIATGLSVALLQHFGAEPAGVRSVFITLAAIYLVFMVGAALMIRVPDETATAPLAATAVDAAQALRLPQFYILWFLLFVNVTTGIGLLARAPQTLAESMAGAATPAAITGFVALLGLFNMLGRAGFALVSDYLGRRHTMMLLLVSGALLFAKPTTDLNLAFSVFTYLLMIAVYGGMFATLPAYIADVFGTRFMGAIHGLILTAWSAGALASTLLNQFVDAQGGALVSHSTFLYAMAVLLVLGLIANQWVRPAVAAESVASPAAVASSATGPGPSVAVNLRLAMACAAVAIPLLGGVAWTIHQAAELPLSWRLGLTLLPLGLGITVCVGFRYLDASRFAVRGIVGPYFAAVALLFALFASLLATEVWQKISRANLLLNTETSALQAAVWLGSSIAPGDDRVQRAAAEYAREVARTDREPTAPDQIMHDGVAARLRLLYAIAADTALFANHPSQQTAFVATIENARAAHLERNRLRSERVAATKLFSLFLFGLLTQIAIAFCHAGNARALATSVMLFSVAFAGGVAILELLDDSFRVADAAAIIASFGGS